MEDALISYQWRNNPRIWRYTGSKPDRHITPEIETEWLANALKRENELRFAICLSEDGRYIGNVFFTDITPAEAQVHIFIGDMKFWGSRRADDTIARIVEFGFTHMSVQTIYGLIGEENRASLALARRTGFVQMAVYYNDSLKRMIVRMEFTREMFERRALEGFGPR
jgi:RimJ/RimL family protein N-acetyltransferase